MIPPFRSLLRHQRPGKLTTALGLRPRAVVSFPGRWWRNNDLNLGINSYNRCLLQLTHWGRVTHNCVSKLTIIGPDKGLSPAPRQAMIWTNARTLLTGPLGTNFSEILIEIYTFSFKKMHLKMLSGKWRPFCLGLNVFLWPIDVLYGLPILNIHYNDVIMTTIASQITSLTVVYSIVYSDADRRKHQSSASLAFVRGIHRGPVNSLHKWPVTRKMFPFDGVIMQRMCCSCELDLRETKCLQPEGVKAFTTLPCNDFQFEGI